MTTNDLTITLLVDETPGQVFKAIQNVRGWWSEEIEGNTAELNDVFDYHFEDIHRCRIKLVEVVPGKKMLWHVLDNYFKPGIFNDGANAVHTAANIPTGKAEWVDTHISFELAEKDGKTLLTFTHIGLVPDYECFEICSTGWTHYIHENLFNLITIGRGQPNSTGSPMTADEANLLK